VALSGAESSWPQFLGPNRNGISNETGITTRLPEAGPLEVWRVKGGVGMSGIVTDGKRAITMVESEGQQTVLALEATTGKKLWQTPVAKAYRNGMGNGTRGTPTIAADSVFVFTGEGILAALDIDNGELRWKRDPITENKGKQAEYGMACSPLVVDDIVIVNAGVRGAALVAYRVKDGELAWSNGDESAGYSSPTLLTVDGVEQVVAMTGKSAVGVAPKTGERLWTYPFVTDYEANIATPIITPAGVFISSGENHGAAMLNINKTADAWHVTEVWTSFGRESVMRNEWQTSVLQGAYLYGMDNVGGAGPITHLCCVEAATGKLLWRENRFGKGNLVLADGKLIISTFKGELVIVTADPKGFNETARAKVVESTRQAPTLFNKCVYLRDNAEIVCVDVSTR